jgi:adenylate cyclase
VAKLFLSYDRDDAASARAVAKALERVGHDVWWDRQIKGGAEFSRQIEQALERSEAVVVLWSQASVQSAWVRDEAAVGRETGRLVPATLDGTLPPLGFRQYQTVDLSGGPLRRGSKALATLADAVSDRISGEQTAEVPLFSAPASVAGRWSGA